MVQTKTDNTKNMKNVNLLTHATARGMGKNVHTKSMDSRTYLVVYTVSYNKKSSLPLFNWSF